MTDRVSAIGTLRPNEEVQIRSELSGRVDTLAFREGTRVARGDLLLKINDEELRARLALATARLAIAKEEAGRQERLFADSLTSARDLNNALNETAAAEAEAALIRAQLGKAEIRAPFDGVVGLRNASPGMLVRPGDVIATLDDVSQIKLDFTVPEGYLAAVAPGARLEATAAAFPGEVFVGEVTQIDSRVDPVTRSATVRAIIDNDDRRLIPGMLMIVEVVRELRDSPAVPELAVTRQADLAFVYVVEEGERGAVVSRRDVVTGARRDGMVEITDGLKLGERVVSKGVHRLRAGAPVIVTETDQNVERVAEAGRGA
jgi:membrane fusion protein (multidrug efflux system)